jgi:NAD(P)H-hydrate epimerase
LVVDGLFGIGINRPLAANWIHFLQTINESGARVLAVDVPSGLNGDTGEPMGNAIQATLTVTLGTIKEGLLRPSAWRFVGRLEVAPDIGLVPCPFQTELNWISAEDFRHFPPRRPVAAHKGTFGHLAIFAGSLGYHGAAVLAARGAQRAQPGLITLYVPRNVYVPIASQVQSVMVQPNDMDFDLPPVGTAILAGPGLASPDVPTRFRRFIGKLWSDSPAPVIVDASALDWLPAGAVEQNVLRVITPHPGEAARLLDTTTAHVQADRRTAVRELSRRFGNCWVVLKGHQTLIGQSAGNIFVNSSGNPHLAQGGSGDLLAGYLAGLLAQPPLLDSVERTIGYAIWQHGATADDLQATQRNWTVEQLATVLGAIDEIR